MTDNYIAHFREDEEKIQSVSAHNQETAILAKGRCMVDSMALIVYLAAMFHDAGKYGELFQEYIRQGEDGPIQRGDVNHATAGGLLIEELVPRSNLSEMVQIAIYSHHGMYDAINIEKGESLIERRQSKDYQIIEKIELDLVRQRFYQYTDREVVSQLCRDAKQSLERLIKDIKNYTRRDEAKIYGSREFYFGMHERLLISLLIDADRSNTAEFMNGIPVERNSEIEYPCWNECITYFENYIERKFPVKTKIDGYRREISDHCLKAATKNHFLYRLTLPTGSGKTLSGLRFALHHAEEFKKKRIIYLAPFNSILEQNAEEIRKAIGKPEIVLEHHCNVIQETPKEQEKYDKLTENWSSPIVATTAVQFLNTLFSAKTGSVRRMQSLCDSIIIFDEIQALPVRIISLFNLAVNYLTTFCNTTVVLCSATQPVFDKMPQNRLLPPEELVEDYLYYDKVFRRVTLLDKTELRQGGMSIEELGGFVIQRYREERQVLVIVNTKACARNLYHYLKTQIESGCSIFHLSTNMCALNRRDVLEKVGSLLSDEACTHPVICISTQLMEAGVDLSFRCVIRSLAGLDSIIQAAGRCNRHGKQEIGYVYIVKMSKEAEDVSRVRDIKIAQEVMEHVLYDYCKNPELMDGDLLSDKAKKRFYLKYLQKQMQEVDFLVQVHEAPTTLVDMLSGNQLARKQYCLRTNREKVPYMMRQAFKTAGDLFEVISEDGKVNVVVEYNDEVRQWIDELQSPYILYSRQKEILRKLQLVTVGISEQTKNHLGRAITPICGGLVNVLNSDYYSKETGVSMEPIGMKLLFCE